MPVLGFKWRNPTPRQITSKPQNLTPHCIHMYTRDSLRVKERVIARWKTKWLGGWPMFLPIVSYFSPWHFASEERRFATHVSLPYITKLQLAAFFGPMVKTQSWTCPRYAEGFSTFYFFWSTGVLCTASAIRSYFWIISYNLSDGMIRRCFILQTLSLAKSLKTPRCWKP